MTGASFHDDRSDDTPRPTVPELLRELADWLRDVKLARFALTCEQAVTLIRQQKRELGLRSDEIERLRAEVDRWKLMLTVPHAVVPDAPEVKPFGEADIADHAYTWERQDGEGFGEYAFETAGDPRDYYDDGAVTIVRKRWVLIERTVLP